MFSIALLAICLLFGLLYLWYKNEKGKYADLDKLPGPTPHFFYGNALEFGNNIIESFSNIERLFNTYGPILRIWQNGIKLSVFVVDPDIVEYFLSSNVHIKKSAGYDLYQPWLGQGLINNTGELWRKHRKILTPAFHLKILEQFSDSFHKSGQILIQKLKQQEGKDIDIYKFIILYAMDAICDSSMRIDVNAQETGDTTYIDAVKRFLEIYLTRFFSIFNKYEFFFQFAPEYKQYKEDIKYLQTFTRNVIEQRKHERATNPVQEETDEFGRRNRKKVFLDILLDSNSMTDREIREEVDTFMFGGHDTISSTISFALFELAKSPDMQEKLLEEIEAVVGVNKEEPITLRHLNDMGYMDRVVKEVLRLYPAAPLIERELEQNVVLNGLKYPKGTTISFHFYIQHRRPELFPDPTRFDPDRFLPENVALRHTFAYIPFSAGPRNCIGQKYATINMKITIANILRYFEVHPVVPAHTPILANDAVLKSTNGLPIKLKLR
ncbi:cytochrome p450 family 4 [Holotrichia oblita]|uniref:Cytochrome p450 family 4 n=1 Tax=Holotrichia oblita TaxID=644536 RepID=A0ACB9TW73_HOLOL|nr:cytochrome p450 family 4 [Holotrichia oblita]